jgi:hypothetical protein
VLTAEVGIPVRPAPDPVCAPLSVVAASVPAIVTVVPTCVSKLLPIAATPVNMPIVFVVPAMVEPVAKVTPLNCSAPAML